MTRAKRDVTRRTALTDRGVGAMTASRPRRGVTRRTALTGLAVGSMTAVGVLARWVAGTDAAPFAIGEPAPAFDLVTVDGVRLQNESLRGKVLALNFWATYCGSCMAEIGDLNRLACDGVEVIGVALDFHDPAALQQFAAEHQIAYKIAPGDEKLFERYDGTSIPYTILIDRNGLAARAFHGPASYEVLAHDARELAKTVAG